MSILDTFYILFKTDAADAAKDLKKVEKASDDAADGLSRTDKAAVKMSSSFIKFAKDLAAPLAGLLSIGSLYATAIARADHIGQLDRFSVKLNSTISDVDAFQRAVKGVGGETDQALDSLVKIGEMVNEAFSDKDSGIRKDFEGWGLAFKNTKGEALGATDAMLKLAANLEKVSAAEALARIKKLGIEDAATIDLLMMGRKNLEEHIAAQKEMGVVTERQAAVVRDYQSALGDAQNTLSSFGNRILEIFLPAVTRGIEGFTTAFTWLRNNQRLVEGFFLSIGTAITTAYLPAVIRAAWWTAAALWPYISLIAVIGAVGAAFALAYEDVRAFMDGQPSLIGTLAEKYKWFADVVEDISGVFGKLGEAAEWLSSTDSGKLGEIARTLLSLDGLDAAALSIGALTLALSPLARTLFLFALAFSAAKTGLDYLSSLKTDLDAKVAATVAVENPAAKPGYVESAGYDEKGEFIYMNGNARVDRPAEKPTEGFSNDALDYKLQLMQEEGARVEGMLSDAHRLLTAASNTPLNSQTKETLGPPVTNNDITNTVNVGGVTVNTQATDAKAIAGAVRGALASELRNTSSQFDDGVEK